jgi:hypothetical protein
MKPAGAPALALAPLAPLVGTSQKVISASRLSRPIIRPCVARKAGKMVCCRKVCPCNAIDIVDISVRTLRYPPTYLSTFGRCGRKFWVSRRACE